MAGGGHAGLADAPGHPGDLLVQALEHVREGAVVVDVGIHSKEEGGLTGDVRFEEVEPVASCITPVPGGVGPMTRAMLLYNALEAARAAKDAGTV